MHCQDTGVLPLKIVQCYSDILFQEIMFIDPSKSHFAVQWQMHLRQLNYLNFDFLLCCWPKRNRISIPFVHDLNDVNRPKRKTVIKGIPRLSTENMHECDPLNTYFLKLGHAYANPPLPIPCGGLSILSISCIDLYSLQTVFGNINKIEQDSESMCNGICHGSDKTMPLS